MTEIYEQGTSVTIEATWESVVSALRLTIRAPDETEQVVTTGSLATADSVTWSYGLIVDQPGDWHYLWEALSPGVGPIEGAFTVDANQTTLDGVTDLADIRTLIPRVRRALEGPGSTGPLANSAILTDDQITAQIADAIADIILYTGSAFGHTLNVTSRDAHYMAPNAWTVDPAFTLPEESVVVAQAALGYFFHALRDLKVQEEISDEASTWSYQLSSSLIRDQMKMLQESRDRALTAVESQGTARLDTYISFISERDAWTSRLTEPWAEPWALGGWAQDGIGGLSDGRFGGGY